MPSLREIQRDFGRALAGGDAGAAARHLRDGALPAAERIGIYANNSWMAFRTALELSFPAVARLGGAEWFASVARRYRAAHPSRHGDLQHVGSGFAAFLADELGDTAYAVVADVAALEWAYQEVLVAADAPPFDGRALSDADEASYPGLRFPLVPACRLVASPWPVLTIWQANRQPVSPPPDIDLDAGPDRLLLRREGLEVLVHRLDPPEWTLLAGLAAGAALGGAAEAAAGMPDFDLTRALTRFMRLGVLASPTLPAGHASTENDHVPR